MLHTMLDIKFIRENPEKVKAALAHRNVTGVDLDRLLRLDQKRRSLIAEVDSLQAEQNRNSEEVAKAKREKDEAAARILLEKAVEIKVEIQKLQPDLEFTQREYDELMVRFPNIPADDVPVGKSEKDNVVIREVWFEGEAMRVREEPYAIREEKEKKFIPPWPYQSQPGDYFKIAEQLDWIDTERAAKVSGARFGYLKRAAVLIEFALVELAFKTLLKEGFIPVVPPVLVKPEMLRAMGKTKFIEDDDAFYLPVDDRYLVGSAEHTLGPMHAGETFAAGDLPRRYLAFSSCFRREAGSYGKDTRGILRVHQFDKLEMFSFVNPEESGREHDFLLFCQERLMQQLRIPYRVLLLSTGDMGWVDVKQYDVEAWLPGQGRYRETHSVSNTGDFQARGINARYKTPGGENEFVHMLNATAFAIGRMIIAIIENYQRQDGTVAIPEALKPYMI